MCFRTSCRRRIALGQLPLDLTAAVEADREPIGIRRRPAELAAEVLIGLDAEAAPVLAAGEQARISSSEEPTTRFPTRLVVDLEGP